MLSIDISMFFLFIWSLNYLLTLLIFSIVLYCKSLVFYFYFYLKLFYFNITRKLQLKIEVATSFTHDLHWGVVLPQLFLVYTVSFIYYCRIIFKPGVKKISYFSIFLNQKKRFYFWLAQLQR